MRIIQTVNDTIRLLFNPKTEIFRLSDFLLVRDFEENFLAQVVEVYDDKFDQESNVAKIKLIFKIVNGNEIAPYDNYTPSRECEVARIKQSEIEKCINLNKQTVTIGKNPFTKEETTINTDFFNNNCAIFADRFEQTNQIFENLAPKLANHKNVLIIDCSGACKIDDASVFTAGNTFKMPLSSKTIEYIQQKTLFRAKLETQVILEDVFTEVKNFLESTEENYIPYNKFIRVIQNQCRQTPSVELLVLISWLKKYNRQGIFAGNKREFESFFKSISKNKVTILDLSNIKSEWQKEHVDYITSQIKNDTFVLIRLNDNNINNNILNSIYLKRKNVTFLPSFAYGNKKVPYIMEFVPNCILMPTKNPGRDFSHANFQIECLNKSSYMLFGEDTKDFIFILENEPSKRKAIGKKSDDKDKMFISLNLQLEDMTPLELMPDNFEIRAKAPTKRRLQEEITLLDVLGEKSNSADEQNKTEAVAQDISETAEPVAQQSAEPKEDAQIAKDAEYVLNEDELDYFEQVAQTPAEGAQLANEGGEVISLPASKENQNTATKARAEKEPVVDEPVEDNLQEPTKALEEPANKQAETTMPAADLPVENEENITQHAEPVSEDEDILASKAIETALEEAGEIVEAEPVSTLQAEENEELTDIIINDDILDAIDEENQKSKEAENATERTVIDDLVKEKIEAKEKEEISETEAKETVTAEKEAAPAKKTPVAEKTETAEKEALSAESQIEEKSDQKKASDEEDEEINKKFDEILNETETTGKKGDMLQIDGKVSLDLNKIKKDIKSNEKKLPVFDDDEEEIKSAPVEFKEGDKICHDNYGEGSVLKVIKYGSRCLLQIEFPKVGKRLLDPKIAKLKPVE